MHELAIIGAARNALERNSSQGDNIYQSATELETLELTQNGGLRVDNIVYGYDVRLLGDKQTLVYISSGKLVVGSAIDNELLVLVKQHALVELIDLSCQSFNLALEVGDPSLLAVDGVLFLENSCSLSNDGIEELL